jgi:methionyl-tRNA formyltransferase
LEPIIKSGVVIFAYHNMGVMAIRILIDSGVNIHLVVTHRDNTKENIWFNSVAELCEEEKINYIFSEDYSINRINEIISDFEISVIFSFYYRNLLPSALLEKARYGAINLHGSYLPKYRGRVPINWQIINGEKEGGVTLHYMVEKPDAGDIIDQTKVNITFSETPLTLFAKLERAGKKILERSLKGIIMGTCNRISQDDSAATYYGGRKPEDGLIDWSCSSENIYNLVRGVTKPYPGAFSYIKNNKIIIWHVDIINSEEWNPESTPGTVVLNSEQVSIRTGNGFIKLSEIKVNNKEYTDIKSVEILQNGTVFNTK